MTNYLENDTRKLLIDPQLAKAGWGKSECCFIEEFFLSKKYNEINESVEPYGGSRNEFVDYVLIDRNNKPLAIIEAKRRDRDPLSGKRQAADYADRIKKITGIDPFIFLTNGDTIYFWDRKRYPPRKVSGFFTKSDLDRLYHQRQYATPLNQTEINIKIANRDYQLEAIRRITEAIQSARRRFLLVMATGTGKTRTVICLVDILLRSKQVQRILFLADRRELVRQAMTEFKAHLPDNSIDRIESGQIPEGTTIHLATYPSMMNSYERISPGFYDLIIADESHRSIYNRYKAIFDRFDAMHLGLTATPTDFIDHNTFELFGCDNDIPTFNYPFEQAVSDKYLVNYRVLEAQTRFQISGIQAGNLPLHIQQQIIDQGLDPEEIDFEGTDIERKVTNTGTNDVIVREFMESCRKDALGLPSKSIVFAVSHAHAKNIYESFNRLYPDYQRRGLAEIIDSHMERADRTLDDFKFKDMPRVAISVDMLDTGIDVPAIQTLLFAKPVFSRVKFWQMIGRGTRLYTDPQTGEVKKNYLIIDCWNNFAFFQLNPEGESDHPTEPLPVRLFRLRLEKYMLLKSIGEEPRPVIEALKKMLTALPSDNINIRPHNAKIESLLDTWPDIDEPLRKHLSQTIAPLMRYYWASSLVEIQFRVLMEEVATKHLTDSERDVARLAEKICRTIGALAETIREVKAVRDKRAWVLSLEFWKHLDIKRLDEVQETFAPLMRFRQSKSGEMVELNIQDRIASRRWIIYGPTGEGAFADNYRKQVEAHVRSLSDNLPALIKIKQGELLDEHDIEELAGALNQADLFITEDLLREVYEQPAANLPDFIRHILELTTLPTWEDHIKEAFDTFISDHGFMSASQINFLRAIRTAVLRRAKISQDQLKKPPLSRIGAVENIFKPQERKEIIAFANHLIDEIDEVA